MCEPQHKDVGCRREVYCRREGCSGAAESTGRHALIWRCGPAKSATPEVEKSKAARRKQARPKKQESIFNTSRKSEERI